MRPALDGNRDCPRTATSADGHPGWEQRATTDPDRIRAAWSRAPYDVGPATGPSGLCVIDLDTVKDGEAVPPALATDGVNSGEDVLALAAVKEGRNSRATP